MLLLNVPEPVAMVTLAHCMLGYLQHALLGLVVNKHHLLVHLYKVIFNFLLVLVSAQH